MLFDTLLCFVLLCAMGFDGTLGAGGTWTKVETFSVLPSPPTGAGLMTGATISSDYTITPAVALVAADTITFTFSTASPAAATVFAAVSTATSITVVKVTGSVAVTGVTATSTTSTITATGGAFDANAAYKLSFPSSFFAVNPAAACQVTISFATSKDTTAAAATAYQITEASPAIFTAVPSTTTVGQQPTMTCTLQLINALPANGKITIATTTAAVVADQSATSISLTAASGVTATGSAVGSATNKNIIITMTNAMAKDTLFTFTLPSGFFAVNPAVNTAITLTALTDTDKTALSAAQYTTGTQVTTFTATPTSTVPGVQPAPMTVTLQVATAVGNAGNIIIKATGWTCPDITSANAVDVIFTGADGTTKAGKASISSNTITIAMTAGLPTGQLYTATLPVTLFNVNPAAGQASLSVTTTTDTAAKSSAIYTISSPSSSANATSVCAQLFAAIPLGPVGAIPSAGESKRKSLAAIMLSSTECPPAQQSANYVVVSKSPNWTLKLNGATLAQIISWGSASLAVIVPYSPSNAALATLGISPSLDDSSRVLLFLISIERMTSTGALANTDQMVMDVFPTNTLGLVMMFDSANINGKKLESEGGKWEKVFDGKFRLYLPHTSTVAGYTDVAATPTSSSNGLYGLFALVVLPVLACCGLVSWLVYEYFHTATATEEFETNPGVVPTVAYTPQAYIPGPHFVPQQMYLPPMAA